MDQIVVRLKQIFSIERIATYLLDNLIPDLIVAGIVLAAFYILWRIFRKLLNVFLKKVELDETAQRFIQTIAKYSLMIIGIVTALSQLGINTGSILTSLGVVGLTIGFAAKDALSNIISGLFIFWDRPFVIGDLVEIGGKYGRVEEITMRSTRVVTVDGKMLAIPNTEIVNSMVASYTNFPNLRIDIKVTIGPGENLSRVRSLLLELIKDDPRFMKKPATQVVVSQLNDYNVEVEFRGWIHNERDHIGIRFEMREKIFETLRKANVEMPYETFEIYLNQTNKISNL